MSLPAAVLAWAGVAVVVVGAVGALLASPVYNRLHFLTGATSLGAPLVGLALAVQNGLGLATAEVLFTVALLAVSGTALEIATGRVAAQRSGLVPEESPE